MGIKTVNYYTIECDGNGCFNYIRPCEESDDVQNEAIGCGWVLTMDKEWLCEECKPKEPITKTNRDKNNVNPLVECFLKDYGVMLSSGEAAELLKKARVG